MSRCRITAAFLVAVVAGTQGAASSAQSQQGFAGSTEPTALLSLAALMLEFAPVGRAGTVVVLVQVAVAFEDTAGMRLVAGMVVGKVADTAAGKAADMAVGTAAAVVVVGAGRTAAGLVRS